MSISRQTLDAVNKRIGSRVYTDPNELAKEITAGLSALARQPSFVRGLSRDTIADVQGGTTLGVGDPSAANLSDVLVQNPQAGIPRDIGSGLRTRRQARVESKVRDVPAMVTVTATAGASSVSVKIVGNGVTKSSDSATGIQTVGDPLSDLASAGMVVANVVGEDMTASTSGSPFVTSGSAGLQPPLAGQTIFITLAEQWEVVTTWTKRFRKNLPVVTRTLKSRTATITNGLTNVVA
jgi:hypothetical protein